jgi:hypothetical protein
MNDEGPFYTGRGTIAMDGPSRDSWPCAVKDAGPAAGAHGPRNEALRGFPLRGQGDRSLFCDQYDNCLCLAADRDWEGFNCQCCSYPGKTAVCHLLSEFGPIDDDKLDGDDLLYCSEGQMDLLVLALPNHQEDILIDLIDSMETEDE